MSLLLIDGKEGEKEKEKLFDYFKIKIKHSKEKVEYLQNSEASKIKAQITSIYSTFQKPEQAHGMLTDIS